MSERSTQDRQGEVTTFKALPRDPNQEEHRKPRAFIHRPDEDSEAAEEARRNATYADAVQTIKPDDFALDKVAKQPCTRNALLPGIGGGISLGALRFVLGGSIMAACNISSASFVGISVIAYNVCQRRRSQEKDGIRKAVKVLDAKQALKDAKEKGEPSSVQAAAANAAKGQSTASVAAGSRPPANPKEGVSFWSSFRFW